MPHDFDIPTVSPGDPIKAADWNKVVRALRPRIEPGGYQSDAFNLQRQQPRKKKKSGQSSVLPLGRYAKVVGGNVPADTVGDCVWLNDQLEFEYDPDNETEQEAIDAAKFSFRNAQQHTGILDGARIALFGPKPVTAGSTPDDTGVAGFAVDVADQLAMVYGDGALVGTHGSAALGWDKTECPTP